MTSIPLKIGSLPDEHVALVALIQSKALPLTHLAGMVEYVGSAVRLLENTFECELNGQGVLGVVDQGRNEALARAAAEVETWRTHNYHVATVLDSSYPPMLHGIFDRPSLLFTEGNLSATRTELAIAVVGTRKATEAGIKRARKLTRELAEAKITIVSGLAAGIDTIAHQTALACEAVTVAVVGTGLNQVFPPENAPLARAIVESGGAIVSQFFPRTYGAKWTYPARNITMSGLSTATVVVEASETSGTRIQARVALKHGRAVYLLRSLVDSQTWARKLVDDGIEGIRARILDDTRDVLDDVDSTESPVAFATA